MRRITTLISATLFALAVTAGSAVAMQPPGGGAGGLFGCPDPIEGHPGSYNSGDGVGLNAATYMLAERGHDHPTAWNAAFRTGEGPGSGPIVLGTCDDED